jgi:hypothetical protein
MERRVHDTFGSTDQAPEIPYLTCRLDAVRCAFRYVASIMTVFGVGNSGSQALLHAEETPISPHRFQRL